jgi:hypothetical protein
MFTNTFIRPRYFNPVLSELCKKSMDDYIRRLTEKKIEDKNKLNITSNLVSTMVVNSYENNDPPTLIFPFFCFITATYFCYYFYKRIKE